MADFDVEMIGDTPGDIENRLAELGTSAGEQANDALADAAERVKDDLEKTSPVDTGEYKDSWYIFEAAEDEVWVLNEADHAKYVMLPNSVMVGSSEADLPSTGVLHNVKGVAKGHQAQVRQEIIQRLRQLFQQFKK